MVMNEFKLNQSKEQEQPRNPSTYMPSFTQYEIPQEEKTPQKINQSFDGVKFSEQLYSPRQQGEQHSTLECEASYMSSSTDPQSNANKTKFEIDQNCSILPKIEEEEEATKEGIDEEKRKENSFEIVTNSIPQREFIHSIAMKISPSKETASAAKAYHNILIMTEKSDKLSKIDESFSKVKLLRSIEVSL